jgi:ADP-ribosylation factor-like protein 8
MGGLLSRLLSVFYSRHLDIVLIGLPNTGKSTFCKQLQLDIDHTQNSNNPNQPSNANNPYNLDPNIDLQLQTTPTIGLDVKVIKKGHVNIKIWDLSGQSRYRNEWSRYCAGSDCLIFVVDTQRPEDLLSAKYELHNLLEQREIAKLPLLILANKIDLGPKISQQDLIIGLNLDYITETEWMMMPVSAKTGVGIDRVSRYIYYMELVYGNVEV